jgi:hypothetical protein
MMVSDKGVPIAEKVTMAEALEHSEPQRIETIKFIKNNYSSLPKECVRGWKLFRADPNHAALLKAAGVEPLKPEGVAEAPTTAANIVASANTA